MTTQTPLQMLARLREIETMLAIESDPDTRDQLGKERFVILTSVGRPPIELRLTTDPNVWAAAFGDLHAVDLVTMCEWFERYRNGVAHTVYAKGREDGKNAAAQNLGRLVALNKTILSLLESRRLADIVIRDDNNPDAASLKLSAHIRQQLRSLGVEVES